MELRRNPYLVNDAIDEAKRRVPFHNMIYLGDGPSDILCFSLIRRLGVSGIGVYKGGRVRKAYELAQGRRITTGPFRTKYRHKSDLVQCLQEDISRIALEIVRNRWKGFQRSPRH